LLGGETPLQPNRSQQGLIEQKARRKPHLSRPPRVRNPSTLRKNDCNLPPALRRRQARRTGITKRKSTLRGEVNFSYFSRCPSRTWAESGVPKLKLGNEGVKRDLRYAQNESSQRRRFLKWPVGPLYREPHYFYLWRSVQLRQLGGGSPLRAAKRFSAAIMAIRVRVSTVALPTWGKSTTFSRSASPGVSSGSFS
jgi:hypothetical protein